MVTLTLRAPQGVSKSSVKLPRALFSDVTLNVLPATLVTSRLFGPPVNSTVPTGFTMKLTLPNPRFENSNGFGLVVTEIMHGVGVGIGVGVTCGDASGDAEGLGV